VPIFKNRDVSAQDKRESDFAEWRVNGLNSCNCEAAKRAKQNNFVKT